MRYSDDKQIGLFTFYKQQQRFEEEITRLKRQKHIDAINKQKQRQKQLIQKQHQANKSLVRKKQTKIPTYLNYHTERSKKEKVSSTKQFSQSLFISRKKTQEEVNYLASLKQKSVKETYKERGYFLSNKSVELDLPRQQLKPNQTSILSHRKKFWMKRNQELRIHFEDEDLNPRINLPSLISTSKEIAGDPLKLDLKKINSALRSPGNELIRQIRNNINNQRREQAQEINGSISYIEYNQGCYSQQEDSTKKNLSSEQKHLLQLLTRYRFKDFN